MLNDHGNAYYHRASAIGAALPIQHFDPLSNTGGNRRTPCHRLRCNRNHMAAPLEEGQGVGSTRDEAVSGLTQSREFSLFSRLQHALLAFVKEALMAAP